MNIYFRRKKLCLFQLKKGFTFVETLVVISVLGIVLPIVFTVLYVILQHQIRIFRVTEVKRIGDNIIQVLETNIQNYAYTIYDGLTEICDANPAIPFPHIGDPTSFRDKYKSPFSIEHNPPDLIISYPAIVPPAPTFAFSQGQLNSSKIEVTSFSISCNRASIYSPPVVSISFRICYKIGSNCLTPRPEERVFLDYQSSIILTSYPTL
ncbi:hypothetical protein A3C98_00120 [Candidatus Roizmanbacteria bacterium RIFCSPHIGHO2_02_FULL_37_15]|uniref:Uncharacterized protein n=1 Tax=Candidatus Roizmanbacteria bacterium RIFCSPLOWO2_01_FULL_37_16 TaxID=1802058 RepID=A0A1F7IKS6_9BACT|nr:MAG: hypothetical protein A2859_04695 [Candidatus Roizmanbacteria bacterium RIFCSPHIGHO2_01_FULL_37_16b]OGK22283.1 MAG: hypothetical protein A3C98_00120 [Candidatus Roizmanbacteria bacterium RIFCSPHIGHO2_02_FULL_37_15]OGK31796.1 MAG: hypothetical protein A3F57_00445 [Candidatus Roizmanbacteria bacterium RIFCSPHIGHO2_12_FULL_36_11]OGK43955.1 MAG: hypothetical protein A3B40_04080 [Candidatus Roizmanbacteria bacterium RIFCSPLOWO2_01_FULL_37_16]OGK56448.1 MAG: hypothetical protein A3I50_00405 [C